MLAADRGKLLTALVGVVFSITLVNVQGGLFIGLIRKASMLVDHGQADIWVGHRAMHNVDFPRDIPRQWVHRVRAVEGVRTVEPYLIGFADMTLPDGGFEGVVVVGVERANWLGSAWNVVEGDVLALRQTDGVIVDQCEDVKLQQPRIGEVREIGGKRARIVAKSRGVMSFLVTPYVFTTLDRAAAFTGKPFDAASYLLVQVEPGADVQQVCRAIRRRVPDLDVHPRDDYSNISINFWLTRTGLGISFGASTILGLLVGLIMVGQTLYAMVLDRVAEFGTLKAIGAQQSQTYRILLLQAMTMAFVGSILGLALVAAIQALFSTPQAPIVVPGWLALGSCTLVLAICLISSLLPYWRIRHVDPLMVLQS